MQVPDTSVCLVCALLIGESLRFSVDHSDSLVEEEESDDAF